MLYYLILFILSFIISGIYNLTHSSPFDGNNQNQESLEQSIINYPFLMFLTIVIFGPLMEEIAFRYGIIGSFKNKKMGLILSMIIFSSMHMLSSISTGTLGHDL